MKIEGIVVSVGDNVSRVCLDNKPACSDCTRCPVKGVGKSVVEAAPMPGIRAGQRVTLRDRRSWFVRNRILAVVFAFCAGIALAEALFTVISSLPRDYQRGSDLLAGGIFAAAAIAALILYGRASAARHDHGHKRYFEIVGKVIPTN